MDNLMTTKKHDDEHDEREHEGKHDAKAQARRDAEIKAAPKDAPPAAFPFSASINEPQTVSLPLPEGVTVPKPSITGYDPYECMIGDPDFTLTVTGENFFADSVIHFAGHDEPTTFDTEAKTLSTGIKPSLWTEPVTVQVQVKNGPEISDPVEFAFLPIARSSTRKK
jgi:hypothetical protein